MPYRFLEGLTMADIAFEATGKTPEEMFISSANAITATQLQDVEELGTKERKEIALKAPDMEKLLYDFLSELIFLKDAELLLFRGYRLEISKSDAGLELKAEMRGELIDPKKHHLLVDVKAVSWHKFKVEEIGGGWKAVVIIDV